MVEGKDEPSYGIFHPIARYLSLSIWVFGLLLVASWWVLSASLILSAPRSPVGWLSLGTQILLLFMPLTIEPPGFIRRFLRFSMTAAAEYFPVKVVYEDKEAFKQGTSYVIGYEPHSVMPQGICTFCAYATDAVPPALRQCRILASSAGFATPIFKNLWWWLGVRPVGRKSFKLQLSKGRCVALCPGGVQECLYMEPGKEVAFLRKRHGFVRIALEHGAPLVPVFAFGQTRMYSWLRPFYDWPKNLIPRTAWASMARRIGYVPMLMWGSAFTFVPRQVPLTIVVGKPILVPQVDAPTPEQISDYLSRFISELEGLFERHKAEAGYPELTLTVY